MKILALSPFDPGTVSGNVTTLRRIQAGLAARGHAFEIAAVTAETPPDAIARRIDAFGPDVVHFYHAYKTGRLIAAAGTRPAVVTLSGTDLNECIHDAAHAPAVRAALGRADRLLTYNASLADLLRRFMPEAAPKLRLLPKGALLGSAAFDLRSAAGLAAGDFVFLHAGGVRPVKNNLGAIDGLAPLHREAPAVRLVFAGPVHDAPYGGKLRQRMAAEPWVRHLEHIPPDAMAAAYRGADVVLNTSLSEGLSNALMEAMAAGRPVLAADVPGNRDLIRNEETGLLYGDLEAAARGLYRDPDRRRELGRAAAEYAAATFSVDREVAAILEEYAAASRRT